MVEVQMRMNLETNYIIESFEEVGMTDPFKTRTSLAKVLSTVQNYDFTTQVYSEAIMESNKLPKTVFIPSRQLLRTIIRAAIKFGKKDSAQIFFMRFGLI